MLASQVRRKAQCWLPAVRAVGCSEQQAVPAAGLRFGAAAGPRLMDACSAFCLLTLKFVTNEDHSIMVLLVFFFLLKENVSEHLCSLLV